MDGDLQQMFKLDDEELFSLLGKAMNPKDFGLGDAQAYVRLGRVWFKQQSERLQKTICESSGARTLLDGGAGSNTLLEAAAVADAVAAFLDQETVIAFSVLVARMGLTRYCRVGS
ncbi:hypothetical protein [Catellatospora sp. NPDC049133]|uniref:hypothetical protein n=1 Tax=Catellatospora sp. NPDC049133 TaxID=3155499 RepID=UPI0033CA3930